MAAIHKHKESQIKDSLQVIIKGREEIINRKGISTHKNSKSIQKTLFQDSEKSEDNDLDGELNCSSISADVEYKYKGFGNKTPINLSKLHQEIQMRKSEQKLRELEMKDICPSESSKECNGEIEEVRKNLEEEMGHNLPTSPEEDMDPESNETRFFCCKKLCMCFR
ncbi:unnamed protein product [Blepharisma stoltei]|uniref:Uncharacterized protein n=1 Tax=Blepharisma stoltei TaxID=1481888 RepID=A0AAU9JI41_9CILI|nr:unnamed protein product [Blepharisma stoltei]